LKVVHESSDGQDALEAIERERPAIAIMDIEMPGLTGLDVVRRLRESGSEVRSIILTMYTQEEMVDEAFNLGVAGFVLKQNAVLDILQAVRAVSEGDFYISPQVSTHIVKRLHPDRVAMKSVPALKLLTETELRVLRLVSRSKTSREIGDELHISSRTVDNHRTNICGKLNLRGPHRLLFFALEHKDRL
jgi:DNA-binding NarL/FixJ family response regulator